MKQTTELPLAKMDAQTLPVATVAPSPLQMMQSIIAGGVTENNVLAFEKLGNCNGSLKPATPKRNLTRPLKNSKAQSRSSSLRLKFRSVARMKNTRTSCRNAALKSC